MGELKLGLHQRDEKLARRAKLLQSPAEQLLGRPGRVGLVLVELGVEVVTPAVLVAFNRLADGALDLCATEFVKQRVVSHSPSPLISRR